MLYKVGERHLVMLQYKFIVEWADGSEVHVLLSSPHLYFFNLFYVTPWAILQLCAPSALI